MTFDQIRGPLERVLYIGLTWAAAKGYITSTDVATILTALLAVGAAGYGWWQNRPKAIIQSAEALPGTQRIITSDKELSGDATLTKTVDK